MIAPDDRWQDQVYELLRQHNVTQFAYVPDLGHKILIERALADPQVHAVALTTEEEGVALLAGADLGGARGVLLMQSSGVGNCINMLSLTAGGRFPFLTLVSMRGDFGEACSRTADALPDNESTTPSAYGRLTPAPSLT